MSTKAELRAQIAALKKEYMKAAQTDFRASFKKLFDDYADLKSVAWTQYTPHFNDGEDCTFGAQTDYAAINGHDRNYGLEEDDLGGPDLVTMAEKTIGSKYDNTEGPNPDYSPEAAKIVKSVDNLLKEYSDDDYEEMFGDHVKVTITRKGVPLRTTSTIKARVNPTT